MGAKDTFPSRLLSLAEANDVEPLVFILLFLEEGGVRVVFLGTAAYMARSKHI